MAGKSVREPRERGFFECWVTGVKGMYVGTVDAEAADPNIDAVRVIYIPLKDMNKGWFNSWLSRISYYEKKRLWTETDAVYPRQAVIGPIPTTNGRRQQPGHFDKEVKAIQNVNGEAPWLEDNWERGADKEVARLNRKVRELQNKLSMSDIEMDSIRDAGDASSNPRRRNNRDSDDDSDLSLGDL